MMAPPTSRSSRASRASRSTRHTRRSAVSSLAEELISFSRDMTGNLVQVVGHMQAQAQAQQDLIRAQAEIQRVEAKQREEAQRAEAQALRADAMKREELLIQMKITAEQASADREKAQLEVTQYREQLLVEHELKRQKMLVDANTTLQQEKLKMDVNRDVANLEVLERRETEFHQLQERERERAREAQLKLRELAAQELKERVHLECELVKQQQQNMLLQKQKEIERLEAQVSSGKQASRGKLAQVPEEVKTSSPEMATVELTDSDFPPSPSQNRPRPVKRIPTVASVGVQDPPAPASELVVPKVATPVVSPALGVATGVPLPSSEGPLIIPRGPEVVAIPLPVTNLVVGAQQVQPSVSAKPLDVVTHLPAGLSYAQRYVAPPVPMPTCVLGSVMPVPTAPPLYAGVMPSCSPPMLPSGIMSAPPSSVAVSVPVVALGTDTRSTFVSLGAPLSSAPPIVDTKVVPAASVVTSTGAPPTSQEPAGAGTGQSSYGSPCCYSTCAHRGRQAAGTRPSVYGYYVVQGVQGVLREDLRLQ